MSTRLVSEPNAQELLARVSKYEGVIDATKNHLREIERGDVATDKELLKEGIDELRKKVAADKSAVDRVKDFGSPVIKARLQKAYVSLEKSAKDLKGRVKKAEASLAIQKKVGEVFNAAGKSGADLPKLRGRAKELLTKYENMPLSCVEALSDMLKTTKQRKEAVEAEFMADTFKRFEEELGAAKGDVEKLKKAVGHLPTHVRSAIYEEVCLKNGRKKDDKNWAKEHLAENIEIALLTAGWLITPDNQNISAFDHRRPFWLTHPSLDSKESKTASARESVAKAEKSEVEKLQTIVEGMKKIQKNKVLMRDQRKVMTHLQGLFNANMKQADKYAIYRAIGEKAGVEEESEATNYGRTHFASEFDLVLEEVEKRLQAHGEECGAFAF